VSGRITPGPVGVDHGLSGEGVAEVVRARAGIGLHGEAGVVDHLVQRPVGGALMHRGAFRGDQHGTLGCDAEAVADRQAQVVRDGPA
jgi:hypothetical protein